MNNKKAQAGGVVYFIVAMIMILAVGIPITQSVISTSNLTGVASTIVGFIPVFLALAVLLLAVRTGGMGGK